VFIIIKREEGRQNWCRRTFGLKRLNEIRKYEGLKYKDKRSRKSQKVITVSCSFKISMAPTHLKRSQIPFPVSVGNRDGVLSIMRKLENKKVSILCVLFCVGCHQYKKIRLSLVDYIVCVFFYLRCEILSFLLPLVHLRAAAPLQTEIKDTDF